MLHAICEYLTNVWDEIRAQQKFLEVRKSIINEN